MRWIAFGQEAEGVVAIGQIATGVIAIGQMATGVIAIGQVARGFLAIGQGAVGVFALGMGSVGLVWSVGMIGVGGRGVGLVLPLVPSFGPRLAPPQTTPPTRLADRGLGAAHVRATLTEDDRGPVLRAGGAVLDARFDPKLRAAVEARTGPVEVYAHLSRVGDGWVCDGLLEVPAPRWRQPGWWAWWAVQLGALLVLAGVFWVVAGIPVVRALVDPGGILVGG